MFKKNSHSESDDKKQWRPVRFLRHVLASMLLWVLVVLCGGSLVIGWIWSQRHELMTQLIRQQLDQSLPGCDVSFASASLDQFGRLVIGNFSVRPPDAAEPLLLASAIRLEIDQDLLMEHQRILVNAIELQEPVLTLVRTSDGRWNWQTMPFQEGADMAPPMVKARGATLHLLWEQVPTQAPTHITLQDIDVDVTPTALHQFRFEAYGENSNLGKTSLSGQWDQEHHSWDVSGQLHGLQINQPLMQLASTLSPECDQLLSKLHESCDPALWNRHVNPVPAGRSLVQTASLVDQHDSSTSQTSYTSPTGQVGSRSDQAAAGFSLSVNTHVEFRMEKRSDQPLDFSVTAMLQDGLLTHPIIPLPLDRLEGKIACDPRGIRFEQLSAASGNTVCHIDGQFGWLPGTLPHNLPEEVSLQIRDYYVQAETRDYLNPGLQFIFDEIQPTGRLNLELAIRRRTSAVAVELIRADFSQATIRHRQFPYPVERVSGEVLGDYSQPEAPLLKMTMSGFASDYPVSAEGRVLNPGPASQTHFQVTVDELPIDDLFYRALKPEHREILTYLNLTGRAQGEVEIFRDLTQSSLPKVRIVSNLLQGRINPVGFPFQIDDLTGHVEFDETGWQFTKLQGRHGTTQIHGFGTSMPVAGEWQSRLTVDAKNGHFDKDLEFAIQQCDSQIGNSWAMMHPQGRFDATIQIDWSETGPVRVQMPLVTLQQCEIRPDVFPWRLTDINATATVGSQGVISFENLTAKHNLTELKASGHFAPLPRIWELRFDKIVVDDLVPDHEFLQALPPEFRTQLAASKLREPVSLAGMLEFKGTYNSDVITSAWDLKCVISQSDLYLGVELEDVNGTVRVIGTVDREGIVRVTNGQIDADSLWYYGYHFTNVKGPFQIEGERVVLGSAKMFQTEEGEGDWETVTREERLSGNLFGGEVFLDMVALLNETGPYWLRCTLSRADLERWAAQSGFGQANVRGEMNGYIDLTGETISTRSMRGSGRLLVSPAELYELPIMFQIFQSLRFAPADATAFRHAYAEFRVLDEKFIFDEIGLLGDALNLFGQGHVRFDETIDLDFVYRPPRGRGLAFLKPLDGVLPVLFTVEVEGTLDVPRIKVQDGVRETARGLLRLIEAAPGSIRPPKIIPPPRVFPPLTAP